MNWLLLFMPIAFGLDHFNAGPIPVFLASTLAILPLSKLMEEATTVLSKILGPTIGGLLNATMSNAPELIIGISALHNGLIEMLKASIAGAIIGTLLFGLGLSIFTGNFGKSPRTFDAPMVGMNMGLLTVSSLGLLIPAIFNISTTADYEISMHICILMLILYVASIYYTLNQRNPPIDTAGVEKAMEQQEMAPVETSTEKKLHTEEHEPSWGRNKAIGVLLSVTIALALTSDLLTDSIQPAADMLHLTPFFAGMFLLSMVGNIPQFINSVSFARKDQLTLALSVNLSSVTQLALLVAPILVLSGGVFGKPMDLVFNQFELIAIVISVIVARYLLADQRTTWLEGFMLIIMYMMLAVGFYYLPPTQGS
ncbi:MAG: calcium/proton exchanger [Pseudomonadota bacterium]|jgi:Ca2+:H+ antiporter